MLDMLLVQHLQVSERSLKGGKSEEASRKNILDFSLIV
jgi:hypothetical protein